MKGGLIVRSWSEFKPHEKIIIFVIGLLLIVVPFGFLYKNKVEKVEGIKQELDATISQIENNKDVLRRKSALKQEYKSALSKLENRDEDQPIDLSYRSDLIVRLNELIDKTGVSLNTLQLQNSSNESISISTENNTSNNVESGYIEVPIDIQINGEYGNILKLVNEIEQLKYLIKVDNLNLNSNLKAGLDSQMTAEVNAQIRLVAFATNFGKGR